MNIKKIISIIMLGFTILVFSTGCNTMSGAGEDIEEAGEAVQDAAE